MKVLITGGAGFIGANLSRALTRTSAIDEVQVLDDLSTGTRANLDGVDGVEVRFTEGSVLDYELLRKVSDGVDSIVHLAAIASVPLSVANPRATHDAGATGTLNVFEAARELGVPHVVVASSSAVYGSNPKLPISEDDWTRPLSPYAVSKMATEGYALAYQASYGMKTLAFRFFNVYGPLQPAGHAYEAVVGQVSRPEPINLAYNTNTTLLELIAELESVLGRPLERVHEAPRAGDVKTSQADASRVQALFPGVRPVELRTGLEATVDWYRGHLGSR